MANPERNADIRLFPHSNWEFTRQSRYDVLGMSIAAAVGVVLTIAILVIAKIGA